MDVTIVIGGKELIPPEWADYYAQDKDGAWYWFEDDPLLDPLIGMYYTGRRYGYIGKGDEVAVLRKFKIIRYEQIKIYVNTFDEYIISYGNSAYRYTDHTLIFIGNSDILLSNPLFSDVTPVEDLYIPTIEEYIESKEFKSLSTEYAMDFTNAIN